MAVERLDYSTISARALILLRGFGHRVSGPDVGRHLRQLLVALLVLWILAAVANLMWEQLPQAQPDTLSGRTINPLMHSATGSASEESVDIDMLSSWPLFGEPGATLAEQTVVAASLAGSERDGIEAGARESRLDLTLRGIVASTADGLGSAIIESRGQQDVYAVDDPLPVSGRVTVAKVLPGQVVLNNSGTFELLSLYEASDFDAQVRAAQNAVQPAAGGREKGSPQEVDKRSDPAATELASGYREQLYQNPQSLGELVTISAVRQNGQLRGYRIAPGRDQQQFKLLGFRSGDVVTAVNGMPLSDPGNTMRLYQAMRSATEASFDLLREGQPVSVNVSLGAAASDQ